MIEEMIEEIISYAFVIVLFTAFGFAVVSGIKADYKKEGQCELTCAPNAVARWDDKCICDLTKVIK